MNDRHPPQGNLRRGQNPAYGLLRPYLLSFRNIRMTDHEKWEGALEAVRQEFSLLPPLLHTEIATCCTSIRSLKLELHEIAESAECADRCALCRGACCTAGKYHFTVIDLLAYLTCGRELFTPRFAEAVRDGGCPYAGPCGCLMEPQFRPYTCITFICGEIEDRLPSGSERFYHLAGELRSLYADLERIFQKRFISGLIMNYDRDVIGGNGPILGTSP